VLQITSPRGKRRGDRGLKAGNLTKDEQDSFGRKTRTKKTFKEKILLVKVWGVIRRDHSTNEREF